ncbi:hypothetical protein IV500_16940 [Paeniglutamicibacter antarcticus]|uniref:IrrE N-terminal-like domain-containing protein n=2 Tax=Arthrobacter terrae TaxID=2935737 RepID=A0A931CUB1_9MICC|nr:hypothetical protein [Arthrobacter terrae]
MQDRDLILHAPARSPWHRRQIILHEFSHMILHHDVHGIGTSLTGQLLPGLDSRMILRVLDRSSYETDAELTAEALADRLAARIIRGATWPPSEPFFFGDVFD